MNLDNKAQVFRMLGNNFFLIVLLLIVGGILFSVFSPAFGDEEKKTENAVLGGGYENAWNEDKTSTTTTQDTTKSRLSDTLGLDFSNILSYSVTDTYSSNSRTVKLTKEDLNNLKSIDKNAYDLVTNLNSNQIDASIETNFIVYDVVTKSSPRKATRVEKRIRIDDLSGVDDIVVVEYISKEVASDAKFIGGNFEILVNDPIIAFDVDEEGSVQVDYIVEGDISDNSGGINTLVVEKDTILNQNSQNNFSKIIVALVILIAVALVYLRRQK